MAERDMTPDEMERFERDAVHHEGERNHGALPPASEQETPWSPEEPVATPTPIPTPD